MRATAIAPLAVKLASSVSAASLVSDVSDHHDHAAAFCVDRLQPCEGSYVPLREIHDAYFEWSRPRDQKPLRSEQLADALRDLFDQAGLRVAETGGELVVLGVEMK